MGTSQKQKVTDVTVDSVHVYVSWSGEGMSVVVIEKDLYVKAKTGRGGEVQRGRWEKLVYGNPAVVAIANAVAAGECRHSGASLVVRVGDNDLWFTGTLESCPKQVFFDAAEQRERNARQEYMKEVRAYKRRQAEHDKLQSYFWAGCNPPCRPVLSQHASRHASQREKDLARNQWLTHSAGRSPEQSGLITFPEPDESAPRCKVVKHKKSRDGIGYKI